MALEERNYGAILKPDRLVIDVDVKNFTLGDKPLARLWGFLKLNPKDRETFTVKTPSGGYHFYFTKPPDIFIRSTLKDYPGLEFKDKYIMAGGSWLEAQGKGYTFHAGSPSKLAPCPDTLLALLTRPRSLSAQETASVMADNPIDIANYIKFLMNADPAVEGHNGDLSAFKAAAKGKDLGLTPDKTWELMAEHYNPRCSPPWSMVGLQQKVNNAYSYGENSPGLLSVTRPDKPYIWDKNKDESYKTNIHNTVQLLSMDEHAPLFDNLRYNLLTDRIEFIKEPGWNKPHSTWEDSDAIHCKVHLARKHKFNAATALIHEAAVYIAMQKSYHPIRNYIQALKWDSKPRVDAWLTAYAGAADELYTRTLGRKFLAAAVTRIFNPGCQCDYVLVLEGAQGIGKSRLCRILAQPWFTDAAFDPRNKDAIDIIRGNWIVELAEMEALSKYEAKTLKAFITRRVDRARPAYGRSVMDFPRQCAFIGTINPESEGYLHDTTGNRRYWPVMIRGVDFKALEADRDQLWAEAYQLYLRGERLYIDDQKLGEVVQEEIAKRQSEDPWKPVIGGWVEKNKEIFTRRENKLGQKLNPLIAVELKDIYTSCLGAAIAQFSHRDAMRMAVCLKQLGFKKQRLRKDGVLLWYYTKERPDETLDNIL
jgi:predicted P-loop ATPase